MSNKHLKMREERLQREAIEAARKAEEEAAAKAAAQAAQVGLQGAPSGTFYCLIIWLHTRA
jgi:hypothetical protein